MNLALGEKMNIKSSSLFLSMNFVLNRVIWSFWSQNRFKQGVICGCGILYRNEEVIMS